MSRIAGVLALLVLTTAAFGATLSNDIVIEAAPVRHAGELGSFFVTIVNAGTVPIESFDVVMTLHGNSTMDVVSTAFVNCTAESPEIVHCRSSLALQPGASFLVPVLLLPVSERRLAVVMQATWTAGGGERVSAPVVAPSVSSRAIDVTSNGDEGPGTLRAAIEHANATCTTVPCEIRFRPGAWTTILPNTPLPAITAPDITIDGRAELVDVTITLDGDALWYGSGLVVEGNGLFTIRNLNIRRFPWDGIAVLRRNDDPVWRSSISNNRIGGNESRGITFNPPASGVDIERNTIVGNFRSGVFIEGGRNINLNANIVYENRASGVYVSAASEQVDLTVNEIRQNGHWGVTIGRGARLVELIDNRIYENRIAAIDVGVDGPDDFVYDPAADRVPPPMITSATIDPGTGRTTIAGTVHTPAGEWDITFYTSAIRGSAHGVLGHATVTSGNFAFVTDQSFLSGVFVIASAVHRLNGEEWQTEMSNHETVLPPRP